LRRTVSPDARSNRRNLDVRYPLEFVCGSSLVAREDVQACHDGSKHDCDYDDAYVSPNCLA
jgi:hypothetical protein